MLLRLLRFRRLIFGLLASILAVRFLYGLSNSEGSRYSRYIETDPRRISHEFHQLASSEPPSQHLNVSTIPQEGRHAELLARFISLYTSEPSLTPWQSLTSTLHARYPWFHYTPSTSSAYIPFAAPVTQLTTHSTSTPPTGIVIIVSSRDFLFAAQLISSLRHVLNSTLPIEIAYLSSGAHELSQGKCAALASMADDIHLNDLLTHFADGLVQLGSSGTSPHSLKPFAALASRFSNVLAMDPDTVFLRDPNNLLESHSSFQRTGTLFYHSRAWKARTGSTASDRRDWIDENLLAARVPSSSLQQSLYWTQDLGGYMDDGVVGLNKSVPAVWAALLLTAQLQMPSVREELHSRLGADGVAETWWIAAEMAGTPYGFQQGYAGCIGQIEGNLHQRQMCSAHSLQMDERGLKPLWFSGGLVKNKAIGGAAGVSGAKAEMFEFYMVPGVRAEAWEEQPRWLRAGDEVWCAEGRPIIPVKVTGLEGVVGRLIESAKGVEEKYRDV